MRLFLSALAITLATTDAQEPPLKAQLPTGFEIQKIYSVPNKSQGSWVALTKLPSGDLITSDQYGKLYKVDLKTPTNPTVTPLDLKIGGAHGLLWFDNALYVTVSEDKIVQRGVYKVTDSDNDGNLDKISLLKKLHGGGEHGPHGLTPSPDGKWIYISCGNHTKLPEGITHYPSTKNWAEDHLLPRQADARGHARNQMAPGGFIARFKPDGTDWQLVSHGYRNSYDIAFNSQGELFTYDSDMEWDLGTAWYRPTRISMAASGTDHGWRNGTGKWPEYYIDSVPPIINIGPGSPTGVLSAKGAKFPTRYQDAIFALDWTFATIYAIHLTPNGASYNAKKEEFLTSSSFPLTDAIIGNDGAMYVLTGGRKTQSALYRITYHGNESTTPPIPVPPTATLQLRKKLEAFHITPNPQFLPYIWKHLNHNDKSVRTAARIALENLPVNSWRNRALNAETPATQLEAAVALAHQGTKTDADPLLNALLKIDTLALTDSQKLDQLRAITLTITRLGVADQTSSLIAKFDPLYPANSDNVNRELCRLLSFLQAPNVVSKTIPLIIENKKQTSPNWASLADRNKQYGKDVKGVLENGISSQAMHYAYCLRVVNGPWEKEERKALFNWFDQALQGSGGQSFVGFINNIRSETLANATPTEQTFISNSYQLSTPTPFKNLPQPKGPGKIWTVADVSKLKTPKSLNLAHGRKMFEASLCAACHRIKGAGGTIGPDLTKLASRFSNNDIIESIILPNKVVSDQYQFSIITKKNNAIITGKILDEKDLILIVANNPYDLSQTIEIPRGDIKSIKASPTSPMPAGLINRLNEKELSDLIAYLMTLK